MGKGHQSHGALPKFSPNISMSTSSPQPHPTTTTPKLSSIFTNLYTHPNLCTHLNAPHPHQQPLLRNLLRLTCKPLPFQCPYPHVHHVALGNHFLLLLPSLFLNPLLASPPIPSPLSLQTHSLHPQRLTPVRSLLCILPHTFTKNHSLPQNSNPPPPPRTLIHHVSRYPQRRPHQVPTSPSPSPNLNLPHVPYQQSPPLHPLLSNVHGPKRK